jgi:hypothetical protein
MCYDQGCGEVATVRAFDGRKGVREGGSDERSVL